MASGKATDDSMRHRWVATGFVAILIGAPLPFAGNSPLATAILAGAVGVLLLGLARVVIATDELRPFDTMRLKLPLLLGCLVFGWVWLQSSPLAPSSWWSPIWQEAATALGAPPPHPAVGITPFIAGERLAHLFTYAGVFWLALHLGRRRDIAERVLGAVVYSAAAYAAYGLIAHLSGSNTVLWLERWTYTDSVTGTFINRNHFAIYVGMGMLAGLALLIRWALRAGVGSLVDNRDRLEFLGEMLERRWVLLLALSVLFLALLLTRSRGGLAAALLGVVALLGAFAHAGQLRGGGGLRVAAGVAVALAVLFFMGGDDVWIRLGRLEQGGDSRLVLSEIALNAIGDNPWFGYGPGSFPGVFALYRTAAAPWTVDVTQVHNDYLELALELGVPAAVGWVAMLGLLAWACLAGLRRRRRDFCYPAVALGVTVMVAAHSLVDFSLQMPAVSIVYAALLGIGCAQSWPLPPSGKPLPDKSGGSQAETA